MIIHGHCKGGASPTYRSWYAMRSRCNNKKNAKYPTYGGAGVRVCDRWNDFRMFIEDMGTRPPGTTIDRIDGSKGYEPGNCRWATSKQQQRNIKTNVYIKINGVEKTAAEWAEISGLKKETVLQRYRANWPRDKILSVRPFTGNRIRKAPCSTLTALGQTKTYTEWGKKFGLKANTIRERIRRGTPPDVAVQAKANGFRRVSL